MKIPYEIKIRNCNEFYQIVDAIHNFRIWIKEQNTLSKRRKKEGHLYYTLRDRYNIRETSTGIIIITRIV